MPIIAGPDNQDTALDYDYMVTARYEKGLSGADAPVEYAAIVPSPQQAIATPPPAAMAQQMMGNLRPSSRMAAGARRCACLGTSRCRYRVFRPRSFALARSGCRAGVAGDADHEQALGRLASAIAINYATNATGPGAQPPERSRARGGDPQRSR